jgi:hypothetical protein
MLLGALIAIAALAARPASSQDPIKTVAAGSTWVVEHTTRLDRLVIAEGAKLAAPKGYSLTMTVDGIETQIGPGYYQKDVVLTPTKEILIPYQGVKDPYPFRVALYINNGAVVEDQSVASATAGATITNSSATNLNITSLGDKFNGLFVTGDSTYTVDNPTIEMNGAGGNDFAGFGAAVMASGDAKLTVNHANIVTRGAVRTAVWVGGNSTVVMNDANIETWGGKLPADYQFTVSTDQMKEIPYGLGMIGAQRSTNLIDTGTVYYNRLHLRAHGWGALSSDGGGPTRMHVADSVIETIGSGYGAYANGDAIDTFSHTIFNVADVALVIGGNGSGVFTDQTQVHSGRYGVFMHQGTGGSTLTIDKGSVFLTKLAAIEIKGRGGNVVIDDALIRAENGLILESMDNDDPIQVAMAKGGGMPGGGGAPGGPGGGAPGGAAAGGPGGGAPGGGVAGGPGGGAGGPSGGGPPGGGGFGGESASYSPNVVATIKNSNLAGDLVHAMKGKGDMIVSLEKVTLTGAISLGTASPASGQDPTKETFREIGDVKNTLGPATDKAGLKLTLDADSKWVVTKTSYLTSLTLANGAKIEAAEGSKVTMLVNGAPTAIKAGSYSGKIEVRVVPGA